MSYNSNQYPCTDTAALNKKLAELEEKVEELEPEEGEE